MVRIDMEMPKECLTCRFAVFIPSKRLLICMAKCEKERTMGNYRKGSRPEWCPLKEANHD